MDLLKFFDIAMKLKDVERTGWTERGVKKAETSSDHSLMVALLALVLGKKRRLDVDRAVKMALVHDFCEAIVGDIISKENWEEGGKMWDKEKVRLERKAMKEISSLSGNPEILELWEEFEDQKTPEARFVKDLDKLSNILQAMEYQRTGNHDKPMEPFWDEQGFSKIKDPELRKFLETAIRKNGLTVGGTELRKVVDSESKKLR